MISTITKPKYKLTTEEKLQLVAYKKKKKKKKGY